MAKQEKSQAELYREERKKRLAKAAKKNAKGGISSQSAKTAGRIVTAVIVAAIVAVLAWVVVDQTGVIQRSRTAFTVDGEKVSEAEYSFYYMSMLNQYYSYAQYGYISLDTSSPLSSQTVDANIISDIEDLNEESTWADALEYMARQQISYYKALDAKAGEEELKLDDSDYAEIESSIDELASTASESNYSASAYLKRNYGNGMSMSLYRDILEQQQLASKYATVTTEKLAEEVTDKEINTEYETNTLSYATVSFNYFNVPAATEADSEGNEAATEATLAAAEADAKKLAEATSVKEFATLCKAYAASHELAASNTVIEMTDSTYSDLSGTFSDTDLLAWLTSADTKANTTYVYNDGTSQSQVFFMVDPLHKAADQLTYDSRHVLIKFPETAENEDGEKEVADSEDTGEVTKVEDLDLSKYTDLGFAVDNRVNAETAKNKTAFSKIQDVLAEYLDGEHTEDAFAALAEKYSEDEGSVTNGGLYEGTTLGSFVLPYEEWCLTDGRKEGDVGIVEYDNEENYSGYHLIYFIKTGETTWKDAVIDAIASSKYEEQATEISDNAAKPENVNENVTAKVVKFVDDMLRSNAARAAASSAAG